LDKFHLFYGVVAIAILFVAEYIVEYKKVEISDKNMLKVYSVSSVLLISLILSLGVFDGGQFIYFQF
jgi:hypothetical protein